MRSSNFHGLFASLMLCAATVSAAEPPEVVDPIDRPAMLTHRAVKAVLLDITRAGDRLVAVGERGTVLLSDDSGKSWRQAKQVPVAVGLTRVVFPSPLVGWIVGHAGVVLKSQDGGETWIRQLDGRGVARLALQAAQGMAARSAVGQARPALESAERLVADGPDKPFLDLHFFDERDGFVVGAYGIIFRTRDGGRNWQPWMSRLDNSKGLHLNAIVAVGNTLYIVGERGLVLRSGDRGERFVAAELPYAGSFFTVASLGGRVVIGGLRGNAFASGDQGRTWSKMAAPSPVTLIGVATMVQKTLLFINQAGELLQGDDDVLRRLPLPPLPPVTAVVQAADGTLVAASFRGPIRLPASP